MKNYEFVSPNVRLGKIIGVKECGRVTIYYREYGVEKFTKTYDPSRCKLEIVSMFPRKIIDLKQLKYRIKRSESHGNVIIDK